MFCSPLVMGPTRLLSPSAFRELEEDTTLKLEKRHLHGAFWLYYAAHRLLRRHTPLREDLGKAQSQPEGRARVAKPGSADDSDALKLALVEALKSESAATFAEKLIRWIDSALLQDAPTTILLYDGLDVGFGSEERCWK